jgi:hypothetical protein
VVWGETHVARAQRFVHFDSFIRERYLDSSSSSTFTQKSKTLECALVKTSQPDGISLTLR